MKKWLAFVVVGLVAGTLTWPKSGVVARAAQGSPLVQLIPPGQKQVGNPGEKGATYYGLEAQTTRLTTRFRDGHEAVTERGLVGEVMTTLRDESGNERARLRLNRIDGGHDMLHFEPSGGAPFQALSDPVLVKPTLDWATRQAYSLVKDGTDNLVWDGGMMRRKGVARRDVESDIESVETVWANGLVARLTRQTYTRRQIAPGRFVQGKVLVSELTAYGAPAGTAVWFEQDRVFAYTLPGLMAGGVAIGPEDLKANYGGWPFTPRQHVAEPADHRLAPLQEPSRDERIRGQIVRTDAAEPVGRILHADRLRQRSGLRRFPLARRRSRSAVL